MQKHVLFFLLMIAPVSIAAAQTVSIGVLGGVPFLDRATQPDESRPYIIGPSIEVRLPAGFALEADALYQRIGNSSNFSFLIGNLIPVSSFPVVTSFSDRLRGNVWEFPLLGKYYFRPRTSSWQPFIGTGYAFRIAGLHQAVSETILDADGTVHPDCFHAFHEDSKIPLEVGAVFEAGLRYRVGHFALLPQVRYTHWSRTENFIRNNKAAVMLGITF